MNDRLNQEEIRTSENRLPPEPAAKPKKNEKVVIESIRLLLDTLNLSELKYVNNDIQKMLKDKNK